MEPVAGWLGGEYETCFRRETCAKQSELFTCEMVEEEVGDEDLAFRQWLGEKITAMPEGARGPVCGLRGQIDRMKLMGRANDSFENLAAQGSIAGAKFAQVLARLSLSLQRAQEPAVVSHDPIYLQEVRTALDGMRILIVKGLKNFRCNNAVHARPSLRRVLEQATFSSVAPGMLCIENQGPICRAKGPLKTRR